MALSSCVGFAFTLAGTGTFKILHSKSFELMQRCLNRWNSLTLTLHPLQIPCGSLSPFCACRKPNRKHETERNGSKFEILSFISYLNVRNVFEYLWECNDGTVQYIATEEIFQIRLVDGQTQSAHPENVDVQLIFRIHCWNRGITAATFLKQNENVFFSLICY